MSCPHGRISRVRCDECMVPGTFGDYILAGGNPKNFTSPETRLLRVIYGLCPLCDIPDEHAHGSWINGEWFSLANWANRPKGHFEYVYSAQQVGIQHTREVLHYT